MKLRILMIAVAMIPGVSCGVPLDDGAAKALAEKLDRTTTETQSKLNAAIERGDRASYKTIIRPLQQQIDIWPAKNGDNRPMFPYWACKAAAVDLLQYGQAWERKDKSKIWRDHMTKSFRSDQAECKKSLASPDLSLKGIK